MNSNDKELKDCLKKADVPLKSAMRRLHEMFPVGARVEVKLRSGQKVLTPGVVIGHRIEAHYAVRNDGSCFGGIYGYVNVEIDNAKQYSRNGIRSIHSDNVRVVA